MTIDDLFGGKVAPFTEPFAFLDPRPRFGILYYPFPFKKRLKVTTTDDLTRLADPYTSSWYQYTYLTYADARTVTTWAGPEQDSPTVRSQWTHLGLDPKPTAGNVTVSNTVTIPKAKSAVLAELRGAGSIASLKLRLEPYGRKQFYHTILRIYWDGAKRPAVEMPLGLFFGGGGESYANCKRVPEMSLRTLFYGFDGNKPRVLLLLAHALLAFGAVGTGERERRGPAVGRLRARIQTSRRSGLPGRASGLFLRQAHRLS